MEVEGVAVLELLTKVNCEAGLIRGIYNTDVKFNWGDKARYLLISVAGLSQELVDEIAALKWKVDLAILLPGPSDTLQRYTDNRVTIYDAMHATVKNVSEAVMVDNVAPALLGMAQALGNAVNYPENSPELGIEKDTEYAAKFATRLANNCNQAVCHHIARVEQEKSRRNFEANGIKPRFDKVVDLQTPGLLLQTIKKNQKNTNLNDLLPG